MLIKISLEDSIKPLGLSFVMSSSPVIITYTFGLFLTFMESMPIVLASDKDLIFTISFFKKQTFPFFISSPLNLIKCLLSIFLIVTE